MSRLPEYLWDFSLSSLAIPGSHNSYSFYIDREANVDRASDPIYRQFSEDFGELAADISYRWTLTQETTLIQQLDLGVRYFDMRVTTRPGKEDKNVYFRSGPNILQALKEFKRWLEDHPQEVILIDFRVVHGMSPAHHRYLLANMRQDVFENLFLECTGNVRGVTLRNMWATAKQIIIFYPKEHTYGYTSVWPNDCVDYCISEDQTAKQMIQKLDTRHQHGRPPHVFFCWFGVMTPNNAFLIANLEGTLKEKLSKPALRAIMNWIRDKDVRYNEMNIVVADFVDLYNFCTEVIQVNFGVRQLKRYYFESRTCDIL